MTFLLWEGGREVGQRRCADCYRSSELCKLWISKEPEDGSSSPWTLIQNYSKQLDWCILSPLLTSGGEILGKFRIQAYPTVLCRVLPRNAMQLRNLWLSFSYCGPVPNSWGVLLDQRIRPFWVFLCLPLSHRLADTTEEMRVEGLLLEGRELEPFHSSFRTLALLFSEESYSRLLALLPENRTASCFPRRLNCKLSSFRSLQRYFRTRGIKSKNGCFSLAQ